MSRPAPSAGPGFLERVRSSFALQGLMRHLGAELLLVEPGRCTIAMPFRREFAQQDGFFHAGALTSIADSAAGYAAFTLMPADARVLTVELKINLLAPARGERAIARGEVVRAGRTLTVTRAEVAVLRAGEEVAVALMQATMMALRPGGA